MKLAAERRASLRLPIETFLLFAFEDERSPAGRWAPPAAALEKSYAEAARNEDFKGKEKSVLVFYPADGRPALRVVVVGLGKRPKFDGEKLRRAAGQAANRIKSLRGGDVTVVPPDESGRNVSLADQAQAVTEGVLLALYEFTKYKSKLNGAVHRIDRLRFVAESPAEAQAMEKSAERGRIFAEATCLARNLVNEPPSVCTPRFLAAEAARAVRGERSMSIRVFDETQAKRLGMGGLLGVSAGSAEPPRFVHLSYRAAGAKKTVAIIGKGITFDSGGLCLKPADGMLNMKNDMSGAACVIGIFRALRELKPRIHVHGVFAATENMPGGSAYKTRDVLRAMNGKTMEIVNTDAEGRLVLSDALSYASKLKPDIAVDVATLTGACVVALGPEVSGVFGTDQDLVNGLIASGRAAGEKIWQLPLVEDYWDMIKSDVA
ncbi:MAG: leucyl aminopeptidase, partial [Planctomycetes bacterium]|nr:leucyl aminopeptidase [Planctomycetota bacterium]